MIIRKPEVYPGTATPEITVYRVRPEAPAICAA